MSTPTLSEPGLRLEIRGLRHAFGGVQAVTGVDLEIHGGEVTALLGENGAGKSTLMKAVAGALRPDAGSVWLDGEPLPQGDPGAVRGRGVSLIYQELNLVGPLSAAENIALGRESRRGPFVDFEHQRTEALRLLAGLEGGIDPGRPVEQLSVAEQQLVEIAKALAVDARVVIMDEPTSALSDRESERLFGVVDRLAAEGKAIVYITHRLEEVFRLARRVVVMRDGAVVADGPLEALDRNALVKAMVGRSLDRLFPEQARTPGRTILEVEGLVQPPRVQRVDLQVRAGEIVALAGLVGAGRTEVGRALFGVEPRGAGTIRLEGVPVRFRHPRDAVRAGVGWVSEDRKEEGLITSLSVLANLTLPHLRDYAGFGGLIDGPRERAAAGRQVESLAVKTSGLDQTVAELSGGNQQKVALARWLLKECRLLIVDEPTRGVDVSGRYEIYELLEGLARRGVAVLMISSDLPEVLGMADRIVVMHEGRVTGELAAAGATQERLLHLAMGHVDDAA
jgi:ABC-type sugar transport system ATPase subunit